MNSDAQYGLDVEAWAQEKLGHARGFGECQAIGFGSPLVAACVFHNWNPEAESVEISMVSTGPWATMERLAVLAAYGSAIARIAIFRTSERNTRARRLMRRFGASEYIIPDLRGPGEAEAFYTITREQWAEFGDREYGRQFCTEAS
jgi:hypothetical protein